MTDETVPDKGKKRYALSLSIHGIERAGVEGGTRAMEDLVTASSSNRLGSPILPMVDKFKTAPTFGDVLKKTIIYFTYPNPDGWLRGSVTQGGVFFQRYNGNGVDVNRDWPDIGYSFRPYSGLSEPESRALSGLPTESRVEDDGDVLRGRRPARAAVRGRALVSRCSRTGATTTPRTCAIQETAKTINARPYEALKWSPIIQSNDQPVGAGAPCVVRCAAGTACAKIYAQTWGTVYDTINYTTTGALGDWFDSSVGLGADGIDNEMSFSHVDKNIVFDPHTEQLHVDGNKFLIFAHVAEMLNPHATAFAVPGAKGYVPNTRLVRAQTTNGAAAPRKTPPQADIVNQTGVADPLNAGDDDLPVHRVPDCAREERAGRLERRHARGHHEHERAGDRRLGRHAQAPVPGLRPPRGRPRGGRMGHGRRGLQPVPALRPGRAHRLVNYPARERGREVARGCQPGNGDHADERRLHVGPGVD